jgi:hypothetical protein
MFGFKLRFIFSLFIFTIFMFMTNMEVFEITRLNSCMTHMYYNMIMLCVFHMLYECSNKLYIITWFTKNTMFVLHMCIIWCISNVQLNATKAFLDRCHGEASFISFPKLRDDQQHLQHGCIVQGSNKLQLEITLWIQIS